MEAALREIVEAGGDMAEYRRRWEEGRWWWFVGAKRLAFAGPDLETTCKKGRAQGLVD